MTLTNKTSQVVHYKSDNRGSLCGHCHSAMVKIDDISKVTCKSCLKSYYHVKDVSKIKSLRKRI